MSRVRYRLPKALIVFGSILIASPVLNYFALASSLGIPFSYPRLVLSFVNPWIVPLLILPVIIGVGLLRIKKWAWYLFMIYAPVLIGYNVYVLIERPDAFNISALLITILFGAALVFIAHKDISAPYVKMYPRGFRLEKRRPLQLELTINGQPRTTRDLSDTGVYVDWPDCPLEPGHTVKLQHPELNGERSATVVRVDAAGVGLFFEIEL
ncbi:MAG: DUF2127 domain-containing protein, partial [Leptospiraceae bacterium]|nr:DUF2127 domain-containing protein [Leptospiraceae bacterium]